MEYKARETRFFTFTFILSLILTVTILIGLSWLSHRFVINQKVAMQWETQSYRVINEFSELLSSLKDLETGERGFIITGDRKYLEPYTRGLSVVNRHLSNLRQLTSDNPAQQQRINSIAPLIKLKQSVLYEAIKLRSAEGFQSASEVVKAGLGRKTMDSILEIADQAIGEERRLLQIRSEQEGKYSHRVVHALVFGDIFNAMVLLALIAILLRENTRRRKTEDELTVDRRRLETIGKDLRETNEALEASIEKLRIETAERVKAVEALRSREHLLIQESRMAAMGEMLVNISHHWRQPLNVLGLKVQELGLTYKYGGFSEELLDGNVSEAMAIIKHMSQTISDFLNFLTPTREKILFSVDQAIRKAVGLVEENFRNNGITIGISSVGDPQINGDPNEFGQALLNLLMNAKDAFLEGRAAGAKITFLSWRESNRAVVTVTDNAGGIEEKILNKIFDAFFTTKELGKGTGVGLFLSKTIIEANMGGRLSVRNVEGGAEFRIEV